MRPIPPHNVQVASITLNSCVFRASVAVGLTLFAALIAAYPKSAIAQESIPQPASAAQSAEAQTILFVNPLTGRDESGNGSEAAPFQTITHALQVAQPGTTVLLAAGTYSSASGETFPLLMKTRVTIQGDPTVAGQGYVIQGGGPFISPTSARQNIALLAANQAVLLGVTVTNPNPRGYGLWVESSHPVVLNNTFTGNTHDGISTVGNSAPLIQGNVFTHNGANGITIFGSSHPEVRENLFEQTGFGLNISEKATPLVLENRISQNRIGIVIQRQARPVIHGNLIEGSQQDGITAIAQSQPDLGTVTNPGNNIFINNARYDINAATNQIIPAVGNSLLSDRIVGKIDVSGGTIPSSVMVASTAEQSSIDTKTQSATVLINQLPPSGTNQVATGLASAPAAVAIPQPLQANSRSAINIPVPPPEAARSSLPVEPSASNLPHPPDAPVLQADLLLVPNGNAPVGNIGDLPTVTVPGHPLQQGAESTALSAPNAALRYRVLVEADSDRTQMLVRSIAPNAFITQAHGRSLMQAGAFSSRENAEAAVQLLKQNGLRATLEEMN